MSAQLQLCPGTMLNSSSRGDIAEAKSIARFMEKGWKVLKPIGQGYPYDVAIDRGFGLEKVQIKATKLASGPRVKGKLLSLKTTTTVRNLFHGVLGQESVLYNSSDIDLFSYYWHEENRYYLINAKEIIGSKGTSLTLEAKDPERVKRWARDYEI